jgi:hypothetical protein
MARIILLIGILMAIVPSQAFAQGTDRKLQVGLRSALIMSTMDLSGLDPAFDDLDFDGPKGPHISGFFFLYKLTPYLRIGIETLVANSDDEVATTMNYQAAGPVVELTYGSTWPVAVGVHFGGVIVNAMARQGPEPAEGASTGSFFKGSGGFIAPYVTFARRFGRHELGVVVKAVSLFGESDRGGLSHFSAPFGGVWYGFAF